MPDEKKVLDPEPIVTLRRCQNGILAMVDTPSGHTHIHKFDRYDDAAEYAREYLYPEVFAAKVDALNSTTDEQAVPVRVEESEKVEVPETITE